MFFKYPYNPTTSELLVWFQTQYLALWDNLKQNNHTIEGVNSYNPYHLEDNTLAHTMLVCKEAHNQSKIAKITALFHDLGKPLATAIKDGNKVIMYGHEGISFYLSIKPLKELKDLGIINEYEMNMCLFIINKHSMLFDFISEDGMLKKETKIFDKFNDVQTFQNLLLQVNNDTNGRFSLDNTPTLKVNDLVQRYNKYKDFKLEKIEDNKPTITVLIGVPGSGKSTYLMDKYDKGIIISRDDMLMKYAKKYNIKGNYKLVWKQLTEDDHKNIDKMVEHSFQDAFKRSCDIIIDMTNTSPKTQRKWVNKTNKKYNSKAIVFCTDFDEIFERLEKREVVTGKSIPKDVVINMMKSLSVPDYGTFDEIEYIY